MKLVSISLGSWLLGLAAILLTFYVVEGANLSAADVKGATVMSLIVAALLFSLALALLVVARAAFFVFPRSGVRAF